MTNPDDLDPELLKHLAKHPEVYARLRGEPTPPQTWFGGDGLHTAQLADYITETLPVRRDRGDALWTYNGGVWRPDGRVTVARRVNELIGDRSRSSHTTNVVHYLTSMCEEITSAPVPEFINCRNGLLDWRTGELHPHTPEVLSTVQLPVEWDPDASCPAVEAWLAEVLPADLLEATDDGPGFIWELLGYLAHSGNPLHKAVLFLGSGRNGKGTLLRLIKALLGDDNVSAVTLDDIAENRFAAVELLGKVANIAGDIDATALKSTARFKAVTGGDVVHVERKYGQAFTFTPWAVPVFSANKVFATPDTSDGYMSRWLVVPFPHSFLGRENRDLDAQLHDPGELRGVLARAVEGLRAVMDRGNFPALPSLEEAFQQFAVESDQVRSFLAEVAVPDPDGYLDRTETWDVYQLWARESAIRNPLGRNKFYDRCKAAGAHFFPSHGKYIARGYRLAVRIHETGLHERRLEPVEAPS